MNEGTGKFRRWNATLASGNNNILLLEVDNPQAIASENIDVDTQVIYFDPGPAWHYMGDGNDRVKYEHLYPNALFEEQYADGSSAAGIITEQYLQIL